MSFITETVERVKDKLDETIMPQGDGFPFVLRLNPGNWKDGIEKMFSGRVFSSVSDALNSLRGRKDTLR